MSPSIIVPSAIAAIRQVMSPPLRRLLWRSLGMTALLLGLVWYGLTQVLGKFLASHPVSSQYPVVDGVLVFLAGAGLLVGFIFLLPAVSAIVAGLFLDDAALVVEATDFPADPPGQPLSLARSLGYGVRFAGLSLLVNLGALLLILVPGVNVLAFFGANAYLLSREYFEMAAGRFRPVEDARLLRREHRATVIGAGAIMAGMMAVPILNLLVPIFGIALMVHLHKRVAARRIAKPDGTAGRIRG